MYSRLQYISQGASVTEQFDNIGDALEAGCNWIQLRFKNASNEELVSLARATRQLCKAHKATFIINDHVMLAKALDADGVHLGLDDMPVSDARAVLGDKKIIGGTANTIGHVLQRVKEKCDYIGLGPFRFTTTKEKLSPVLGPEGYTAIMQELVKKKISVPVYAIGGILAEDIQPLMQTGVHGIAVSGVITTAANKQQTVEQLNTFLHERI
ncbi:MAG: thiamine phosphate synthase [Bacteroidia bacterium]